MPSFPPPRTFTGRGYHPEAITPERKRWHPKNGAHLPAFGLVSAGTREQQVGKNTILSIIVNPFARQDGITVRDQ